MVKQQLHKQPISRFSECDYRWEVIALHHRRGRFVDILKSIL